MSGSGGAERSVRDLVRRVGRTLRDRSSTLSVAESCTGGRLGGALTSEAGASDVFWGGLIVYANEAKVCLAGVAPALIENHGAVSEAVAKALAEGIRARAATDWAIAVTGVAGPGGGTPDKPVGMVWIAVTGPPGTTATEHRFAGDREEVRAAAVAAALGDLLLRLEIG